MEEAVSDSLSIPGWIWFVAGFMLVAVVVMFVLKYQHDDSSANSIPKSRYRSHKHRRHRRRPSNDPHKL